MNVEQTYAAVQRVTNCMMNLKSNGVKEKFPVSLIDVNCWEWPQGIGLYGLYKSYLRSHDEKILSFLTNWYDARIREGIAERNVNTTSPMLTLTYVYELCPKPEYLALIKDWSDWTMNPDGLIRAGDDCIQHMITGDPNTGEILIDTLFMTLLFMVRAGKLLHRDDLIDEANFQILSHIKYLYDKTNRLFYHGWNFKRNDNYGKIHWGRGNAWYTVGVMELAEMEPDMNPAIRHFLLNVYRQQADSLRRLQDPATGQWHTVLDDNSSYIEISASAGFLCGMMKGVRLGILPKEQYLDVIRAGTARIFDYIGDAGNVLQVSYGTPIGQNADFYKNIACYTMTYGQALMLLLLEEMLCEDWKNILS